MTTYYAIIDRFGKVGHAIPMSPLDVKRQAMSTARLRGAGCGHSFVDDAHRIEGEMLAGSWQEVFPRTGRRSVIRAH